MSVRNSRIEWTEATWSPVRGCSMVSAGCTNCYAMKMAHRFSGKGQPYEGLTRMTEHGPRWTGEVRCLPEELDKPLRWRKPTRIFVCSMSDLFHEEVPNEFIAAVFGVMAACPQHTFIVLTKRAKRMRMWLQKTAKVEQHGPPPAVVCGIQAANLGVDIDYLGLTDVWPLPNVWVGVSCEDQKAADERVSYLLETPASIRMVSAEPLLGPIDLFAFLRGDIRDKSLKELGSQPMPGLDWIVVGSESGLRARPCNLDWVRALRDQCVAAHVPLFVKQLMQDGKLVKMPKLDGKVWQQFPKIVGAK